MTRAYWQIHSDGSFDLKTGNVDLLGAYPSIDGDPIRPLAVEVVPDEAGGCLNYTLVGGTLTVVLGRSGERLTLRADLNGMEVAPHTVQPLAGAQIGAVPRLFRQAHGIGGGTGFQDLPLEKPVGSYGVTALIAPDQAPLLVSCRDHRRFDQRSEITPLPFDSKRHRFAAGFLTERIQLPEQTLTLPVLTFEITDDLTAALRRTAEEIGAEMGARPPAPPAYHWCSWYYLYHNLSEPLLDEYLAGFAALDPPSPLQTIQIDAGYFPSAGDWLEPNPLFPNGLEPAFLKIKAAGYKPGIWIGPFMVGNQSRLYREHPDWMLHSLEGRPIPMWRTYGEPKIWGFRDEETYALDTSHPDAMDYLRQVFRTLRGWGAEYFKTDFIYWGHHDSTKVRRHRPGKTSVEYLRDVLQMIREEIGEETFWLGCIAPFFPFIGYADGMRIAGDVGASWGGGFGPQNMIAETVGDQYFNNVWWQNDPDAILLRDFHTDLTPTEVRSLALWQGILGGVINTSDPLHEIAPDRLRLWRFLLPGPQPWTADLPYFGRKCRLLVATRRFENGAWAVLAFNPADTPQLERLPVAELTGVPSVHAWEWSPEEATPLGPLSELLPDVAPHDCALYYLSPDAIPPDHLTLGGGRMP
jgi:hypothetical protein